MINKILFLVLTRIYKVDPLMCLIDSWRTAHPYEGISNELGFSPLIYKQTFQEKVKKGWLPNGIENFIFLGRGKVFLVPILDESYFDKEDDKGLNEYRREIIGRGMVPYTLFKHYIENNPHIVIGKFPTKLLINILKRQIKNQAKNLKENEKNTPAIMSISSAVESDLRANEKCNLSNYHY